MAPPRFAGKLITCTCILPDNRLQLIVESWTPLLAASSMVAHLNFNGYTTNIVHILIWSRVCIILLYESHYRTSFHVVILVC